RGLIAAANPLTPDPPPPRTGGRGESLKGTAVAEIPTRRDFLKTAAITGALPTVPPVHTPRRDPGRGGPVGCGRRRTGAASQARRADKNVQLVAMGDAFEDRLQESLTTLQKDKEVASKIAVKPDRCFVGFDAYKQVIAAADVVLLTTPPHFRPIHLKAAIEAGKHVFAEKPVAVDAPGVRSVIETCKLAAKKNLSVVSGLCLRYDDGFKETAKRLHDGAVGDIVAVQANDYRGPIWVKPRQSDWTDMVWQMRNWYYFTWLCG